MKSLNDLFRVRIAQALHDLKIRLCICLQQCGLTGVFRRCFHCCILIKWHCVTAMVTGR